MVGQKNVLFESW